MASLSLRTSLGIPSFELPAKRSANIGEKFAFFERNNPFSLSVWVRLDKRGVNGPLVTRSGGVMMGNRGYEIMLHPDGFDDDGDLRDWIGQAVTFIRTLPPKTAKKKQDGR